MLIGNTDMHIVTLLFIVLESVMFIFQIIFFLQRPEDQTRKYYVILLFLLIVKNIAMGLFPDPKIPIPIIAQYILTYGAGFVMASYFPYYFYRAYELGKLRWHSTRGIFILLHLPFFTIFTIEYLLTKDVNSAINHGLYIPAIYGVVLGYAILKAIQNKYKDKVERNDYFEVIAVYCAVIPYAALAFCAYFRVDQVNEALLTNGGFVIITVLFIRKSLKVSREDFERLQRLDIIVADNPELLTDTEIEGDPVEENMELYNLSVREKEVARLVIEGKKYREIGEILFISLSTVEKHVEHIRTKTKVKNRKDLQKVLLEKIT